MNKVKVGLFKKTVNLIKTKVLKWISQLKN